MGLMLPCPSCRQELIPHYRASEPEVLGEAPVTSPTRPVCGLMAKRKAPAKGPERHVRSRAALDFVNHIHEKMDAVAENLMSQGKTFVSYMQDLVDAQYIVQQSRVCALCCFPVIFPSSTKVHRTPLPGIMVFPQPKLTPNLKHYCTGEVVDASRSEWVEQPLRPCCQARQRHWRAHR